MIGLPRLEHCVDRRHHSRYGSTGREITPREIDQVSGGIGYGDIRQIAQDLAAVGRFFYEWGANNAATAHPAKRAK